MAIVKRHFPYPLQTGKRARLFVAVHHTQFGNPQWQFTVGANVVLVDLNVACAVHWPQFKHFAITHVHWREHVFAVVSPVTGSLVGVQVHQDRRVDVLIAVSQFLINDVAFNRPPNRCPFRHPVWQTGANLRIDEEQVQLVPNDTVVAFLGFLTSLQICFQIVFLVKGRSVDPLQHGVG